MSDKEIKIVTPSDLGKGFKTADSGSSYELDLTNFVDDSTIGVTGGKLHTKPGTPSKFVLEPNESAVQIDNGNRDQRMQLQTLGAFGVLHLDFTAVKESATRGDKAFTIPDGMPTPLSLIEHMTRDGGTIWVGKGERQIKFNGLKRGSRYIADLVGFWG